MRLICGFMRLDGGEASQTLLDRMVAQMDVPRLRPTRCEYRGGAVAMAVLDFTGKSSGSLPSSGSTMLAADMRLDEPAELAQADQDAYLLDAVQTHGTPGLANLLGDFAFASWDDRTQKLTCGRDAFGIRPFFYVHKPGALFAFASIPAALHGSGIVPKKIDMDALVRHTMRLRRFDDDLIEGISRLPPGHALDVSRAGFSVRRYWQLDRAKIGASSIAPEDAARELRRLVELAVRSRLPKSARIGSHLSGGLDSSAITILAARSLRAEGRKLHAYSFLDRLRNHVPLEDETAFVKACVEQERDIDWQPIYPTVREFEQGISFDPDLMHPIDLDDPEVQTASAAEQHGVGLILSGWGGDEAATFNGRGAMVDLLKRGRLRALGREIDAMAKERGWTKRAVFVREVVSSLAYAFVPNRLMDSAYRAIGRKANHLDVMKDALSPGAHRALTDDSQLSLVGDGRQIRWRLMTSPHIAQRTEIWAMIGARHGLAYAFPLLDRRVVEFALSLPSEFFLSGGFRRRPFRDAMQDVLPNRVRRRHQKFQPFPGRYADMAEARDALVARMTALQADAKARAVLNFEKLGDLIAAIPSPETIRHEMADGDNPQEEELMTAAERLLQLAAYIGQHGTETHDET